MLFLFGTVFIFYTPKIHYEHSVADIVPSRLKRKFSGLSFIKSKRPTH